MFNKTKQGLFYLKTKGWKWTYNYLHFCFFYDTKNSFLIKYLQLFHPYPDYIEVECTTKCPLKCLTKDALVKTKKGDVSIQNIKVGDSVYSYDINEGKITESIVLEKIEHKEKEFLYKIELENGKILKLTGEHPILTVKGWIEVENLNIGEEVYGL